jgi:hypothetical protein
MYEQYTPVSQLSRDELVETLDVLRAFLDNAIVHADTAAANAFLTAVCRIARHIDRGSCAFAPPYKAYGDGHHDFSRTAPKRTDYVSLLSKKIQKM